jgi:hypothetical protein
MPERSHVTYLTDIAEPPPALGEAVVLRLFPGGTRAEAFTAAGRRLGRLPPAECAALVALQPGPEGLAGRVTALVPRPGLGGVARVHVALSAA